ncbi:MAG: phospholipid carrier-dependent glycosyltransferase, partial [Phycisphaerales bacterium]
MHPRQHDPSRSDPPRLFAWAGWPATWALVLTLLALRLVYLVWLCPYTLVEDEAHYWEWSRRLDLSYYTKGPGVAWLIALATATLGDHAWAVRAPAAIASAVASLAVARLAHDLSDDRRAAFFGALAFNLAPVHHALAMLMTIDGPYLACWAVACMCAWRALRNRSGPALLGLALAAGAGFLLKYTMLLLAPGLALAALLVRARTRADHQTPRRPARRALWPLAATALFLGAISPVLIWNAQRGWPTLAHLLEHLSPPTADTDAPTPPVS